MGYPSASRLLFIVHIPSPCWVLFYILTIWKFKLHFVRILYTGCMPNNAYFWTEMLMLISFICSSAALHTILFIKVDDACPTKFISVLQLENPCIMTISWILMLVQNFLARCFGLFQERRNPIKSNNAASVCVIAK